MNETGWLFEARVREIPASQGGGIVVQPGEAKQEGSVRDAMRLLRYRDPESVHRLIHAGLLKAWRPPGRNTHWRVDLESCRKLRENSAWPMA